MWYSQFQLVSLKPSMSFVYMSNVLLLLYLTYSHKYADGESTMVIGQQYHRYENRLNRDFQTNKSNQKWVTDISYN